MKKARKLEGCALFSLITESSVEYKIFLLQIEVNVKLLKPFADRRKYQKNFYLYKRLLTVNAEKRPRSRRGFKLELTKRERSNFEISLQVTETTTCYL